MTCADVHTIINLVMNKLIEQFLHEDIGEGDITTDSIVPPDVTSEAEIIAKADGVIAGQAFACAVFKLIDGDIVYDELKKDGDCVRSRDIVARIKGKTRAILTGERVALNILQRLSGIATTTKKFVDAVSGTKTRILDTRKTTPGLRLLEKYAVRMGGGYNHRMNLSEMALVKENHIAAAGSIKKAVQKIRDLSDIPIEVEVKNMDELMAAAHERVDRIMLDNWTNDEIAKGVAFMKGAIPLEASGNMTLDRVSDVAKTGVDFISVGLITHSYTSLDLSLILKE